MVRLNIQQKYLATDLQSFTQILLLNEPLSYM